jgi:hypothetical protein
VEVLDVDTTRGGEEDEESTHLQRPLQDGRDGEPAVDAGARATCNDCTATIDLDRVQIFRCGKSRIKTPISWSIGRT